MYVLQKTGILQLDLTSCLRIQCCALSSPKLKSSPWSTPRLLPLWPHLSRFLWRCLRQPWPEQESRWRRRPPWLRSFLPAAAAPPWLPCGRAAPRQTPSWCPPEEMQGNGLRNTEIYKIEDLDDVSKKVFCCYRIAVFSVGWKLPWTRSHWYFSIEFLITVYNKLCGEDNGTYMYCSAAQS